MNELFKHTLEELLNSLVQYDSLEFKIGQTASNPPELDELPEISFAQYFDEDEICQMEFEFVSNLV